jgi:hypothetical protein
MDEALQVDIWNVLYAHLMAHPSNAPWQNRRYDQQAGKHGWNLVTAIWTEFFHLPLDELPAEFIEALAALRRRFDPLLWHQVYDLLEVAATNAFS